MLVTSPMSGLGTHNVCPRWGRLRDWAARVRDTHASPTVRAGAVALCGALDAYDTWRLRPTLAAALWATVELRLSALRRLAVA